MTREVVNMVTPNRPGRKERFKAALALAGVKAQDWCDEQDVTPQHLARVLDDERESHRLVEAVDAFIAKHLTKAVLAA
jgi:hypothetical protein